LGVGFKADDLALKKIIANSKEVKTGQIWQNILRKAGVQKGLFCR
jgi:hypothetical protein